MNKHSAPSLRQPVGGIAVLAMPSGAVALSRGMKTMLTLVLAVLITGAAAADVPIRKEWVVDGLKREAMVCVPQGAKTNVTPLVFVFHGHGGSPEQTARSFRLHEEWSNAIVIYPQGVKTPGRLTDSEGKRTGWQRDLGDQGDRDLKFFDAMLTNLKLDYAVDEKRIYSTGHSNGGAFTYLLWATRGDVFAALAPSGAAASRKMLRLSKPKPVLHIAGEQDALVKFQWQEATMKALRRLNQCGAGEPWSEQKWCTLYESRVEAPVVTCIHPGGHKFPSEAGAVIARFFQECVPR